VNGKSNHAKLNLQDEDGGRMVSTTSLHSATTLKTSTRTFVVLKTNLAIVSQLLWRSPILKFL